MKTPKKILERRREIRIQESLPFSIGHRGYEIQAVTLNLSQAGALCVVDKDIPMLTQLNIGLSLPNTKTPEKKQTLTAKGVVVRKDKDPFSPRYQIAIYFSDIKPKDQKLLSEFIKHRTPK